MRTELIILPLGLLFMFNLIGGFMTMDTLVFAGIVVTVTVAVAVGAIAGLHVLGSGLGDESVHIALIGLTLGSVWLTFSLIGNTVFGNILPQPFGVILWGAMTAIYLMGIFSMISRGGE